MHRILIVLVCGTLGSHAAGAEPDRESLLEAWEAYVAGLPGTVSFESVADGVYRLEDTDLPYSGEVRVVGALVRSSESPAVDSEFTHIGMVDFELVDLPVERLSSQVYYYWVADRQTLYYSVQEGVWLDPETFRKSFSDQYDMSGSFGVMTFMMNYGIWALLIALIIFVFLAVNKQAKKNRALMDETAEINEQARRNVERAASMQDEVLTITREACNLQRENNETLKKILDALRN